MQVPWLHLFAQSAYVGASWSRFQKGDILLYVKSRMSLFFEIQPSDVVPSSAEPLPEQHRGSGLLCHHRAHADQHVDRPKADSANT